MLGEVPGVRALDGHAADRVEQDDVVDDRLERRSSAGIDPRRPSPGPGDGHEVGAAAPDLDELGEDRQGDLLGRLGAEVEAGRRPQRGEPLLGDRRLLAQPLAHDAGPGRRRDEPDVRHLAA